MAKRARKRRKYIRLTRRCGAALESSAWASATRIDEPHRPWRFEISSFQVFDPKAGGLHQIVGFAIEMAATRNAAIASGSGFLWSAHVRQQLKKLLAGSFVRDLLIRGSLRFDHFVSAFNPNSTRRRMAWERSSFIS